MSLPQETDKIRQIKGVQFSILSSEEVKRRSVVNVTETILYDSNGDEASSPTYLDERPVLKTIFYDVPEGQYLAVIKNSENAWISSSIVQVYDQRLSVVKTGRRQVLNSSYCDVACQSE